MVESTTLLFPSLLLLFLASFLSCSITSLQRLGRLRVEEELDKVLPRFFLRGFLHFFFGKNLWEGFLFALNFTKHTLRVGFVLIAFFTLTQYPFFSKVCTMASSQEVVWDQFLLSLLAVSILLFSLVSDFLGSLLGQLKPEKVFYSCSVFNAWVLLFCLPLTAPFFAFSYPFFKKQKRGVELSSSLKIKEHLEEMLQESEVGAYLSPYEKKSILSVVSFKERIAREVMVPRIAIFSIPLETTLEEASFLFFKEGYSRIPVYQNTIDNIIGVLHYKDVLKAYVEQKTSPPLLKHLLKPVLYTPETKKLSHLLQEFRTKQMHLAIVVDEWGGTEGIVTIEDILEELVGEIADEHDTANQELFTPIPGGGWIVDAKMTIIDIQEELGIQIPQSPEYDTIGGYIFDKAGSIPSKGWKIHHDDFDLEVLSSNPRSVEKIRITNTV